jgi:hypothetical protein
MNGEIQISTNPIVSTFEKFRKKRLNFTTLLSIKNRKILPYKVCKPEDA